MAFYFEEKPIPDWLKKCLSCQYCYQLQTNELEFKCRKRNGECEYKRWKEKKQRRENLTNFIFTVCIVRVGFV